MTKTVLLTGATDGIGLETAKLLAAQGHTLLLHGRSNAKLESAARELGQIDGVGITETYRADLSNLPEVDALASAVLEKHPTIDVLINNAGVFKIPNSQTADGYDVRFIVNTVAPYLLTKRLLPVIPPSGRVVNLSSAAQSPIDHAAFAGKQRLSDSDAYAQSKLGITMWSIHLAKELSDNGPAIIAVNPSSFLASKMVQEASGTAGNDLGIGAEILLRAALSDEFAGASGQYYDNDRREFSEPHPYALDTANTEKLIAAIDDVIAESSN